MMLSFLSISPIILWICRPGFVDTVLELKGPKYDGKFLHSKIQGLLGATRVKETLTNVVIPAFDVKNLQPTIFSTFDVKCMHGATTHSLIHRWCIYIYMTRSIDVLIAACRLRAGL